MKNIEKNYLKHLVLKGLSIKRMERMGFKRVTIKRYYRVFNPAGVSNGSK